MIGVSDIVKLLEQVPIWKSLVGLPKRLAELEARVAMLESGKAARTGPGPTTCAMCGAMMTVAAERPHRTYHHFGHQEHDLKCDGCGHVTTRRYIPSEGYR